MKSNVQRFNELVALLNEAEPEMTRLETISDNAEVSESDIQILESCLANTGK